MPIWILKTNRDEELLIESPTLGRAIEVAEQFYMDKEATVIRGEPYYGDKKPLND